MNRYVYIDSEGKQKGTFTPNELRNEHISKNTLVWTQGMKQWMRAYDVAELQPIFDMSTMSQSEANDTSASVLKSPPPYHQGQNQDRPMMPKTCRV